MRRERRLPLFTSSSGIRSGDQGISSEGRESPPILGTKGSAQCSQVDLNRSSTAFRSSAATAAAPPLPLPAPAQRTAAPASLRPLLGRAAGAARRRGCARSASPSSQVHSPIAALPRPPPALPHLASPCGTPASILSSSAASSQRPCLPESFLSLAQASSCWCWCSSFAARPSSRTRTSAPAPSAPLRASPTRRAHRGSLHRLCTRALCIVRQGAASSRIWVVLGRVEDRLSILPCLAPASRALVPCSPPQCVQVQSRRKAAEGGSAGLFWTARTQLYSRFGAGREQNDRRTLAPL